MGVEGDSLLRFDLGLFITTKTHKCGREMGGNMPNFGFGRLYRTQRGVARPLVLLEVKIRNCHCVVGQIIQRIERAPPQCALGRV